MWAIVLAIVTGVIGFLIKIVLDIRAEHQARKSVAAALAGELAAYLRICGFLRRSRRLKTSKLSRKFSTASGSPSCVAVLSSLWSSGIRSDRRQDRRSIAQSRARDIRGVQHHHQRAPITRVHVLGRLPSGSGPSAGHPNHRNGGHVRAGD
jgi:hypothetical protein